MNDYIIESKLK